ncbi:MAG: CbrC family protein [Thermoflexales bacterium]|nr:CbrC family protein [Thermoflexales bacterium]
MKPSFKYFPDFTTWARTSNEPCECVDDSMCLDPLPFGHPELDRPICVDDLVRGVVRVDVPEYLRKRLRASIAAEQPAWGTTQVDDDAALKIDQLERTPPVPWIQSNRWPICHADFCVYLGECSCARLDGLATDGNGLRYLSDILENQRPVDEYSMRRLWNQIDRGWTIIFLFQCTRCSRQIAIHQSF